MKKECKMSAPLQFVAVPGLSALSSSFATPSRICAKRVSRTYRLRNTFRASQLPDGESLPNGGQVDDAQLQRELRDKVKELYGGSENVSIQITGDAAEFTVRRGPDGQDLSSYKTAVATAASIAVISIVVGLLFSFLYYSGAVHGSPSPERRYDMPQFSTSSYIDPYELLEAESDEVY